MKIPKIVDSRLGYMAAAVLTLVSVAAPVAVTSNVSAAVVTARSIEMNNSTANAAGVKYTLTFTPEGDAGATVLEFCNDSPIIGQTCTAPGGFDVSSVTAGTGTAAELESHDNVLIWTSGITEDTPATVEFSNLHNPTAAGQFYARLLTYTDATVAAAQYTSGTSVGTFIDEGGFALSATNPINVSAAVRESMTFCVSAASLTSNCGGATSPNLELGSGTPKALNTITADTGTIYTQISTNASEGATVKMRSDKACGGLHRQGSADPDVCGIPPVGTGTNAISGGTAMFGMKVAPDSGITATTNYAGSNYGLNWVDNDATGVTSPYGDPIYSSPGPVSNKNATLTFAAAADNLTPAGKYTAALNLIATGTF